MSDASKDIELMVFYKREDIAFVELVDCNAHHDVPLSQQGTLVTRMNPIAVATPAAEAIQTSVTLRIPSCSLGAHLQLDLVKPGCGRYSPLETI
jgi:hypothetical protein